MRLTFWTLVCLIFCTGAAGAQEPSDAAKILREFGAGGMLTAGGMTGYVRSTEFKKVDTNKSGIVEFDEYMAAHLYAQLPDCDERSASVTWLEANRGGPLDVVRLHEVNPSWAAHINDTARSHWTLASPGGQSVDEAAVLAYLQNADARRKSMLKPEERLEKLNGGSRTGQVALAQSEPYFVGEWFDKTDVDKTGTLSLAEFMGDVKYEGAVSDFCTIAGDDWLLERSVLSDSTQMNKVPALQMHLKRVATKQWHAISLLPSVPADVVLRAFGQQAKAAADQADRASLSTRGYVPGRGLLVKGTRQLNEAREISWAQGKPATFLRIIKDFTVDDPLKAEPALITIAGERGKETTFALDSTFQLDFYPGSFTFLRAAAGVDVERQTGESASNVQTYYGTAYLFLWHRGWLESSYIRFSPYVEDNRTKRTRTVGGDVIWQPGLRFGKFLTNNWRPIGKRRMAQWYVTPRFALQLGEMVRSPDEASEKDLTNVRVEILGGLAIGPHFKTTYTGFRRIGFGDAKNSGYHELAVRWSLDEHDRFSVKASAADGRKKVTDDKKGTFSFGIGVKF